MPILPPSLSHASPSPSPSPSPPPSLLDRHPVPVLVTITISQPLTTYATVILLGDSFPTSLPPSPSSLYSSPTATASPLPPAKVQTPGIPTGTILGIIIGCSVGFLGLIALFYVYLIRARRREARRLRRWRERQAAKAKAAEGAPAEAAPAAEGG